MRAEQAAAEKAAAEKRQAEEEVEAKALAQKAREEAALKKQEQAALAQQAEAAGHGQDEAAKGEGAVGETAAVTFAISAVDEGNVDRRRSQIHADLAHCELQERRPMPRNAQLEQRSALRRRNCSSR